MPEGTQLRECVRSPQREMARRQAVPAKSHGNMVREPQGNRMSASERLSCVLPDHSAEQVWGTRGWVSFQCAMCLILRPFLLMCPEGEDDRTVCKEIRHNSTGCLKMKGQCEKCQEILSVGESGTSL